MKCRVVAAKQSPLNDRQWSADLACRSQVWLTQKSKPKAGKPVQCPVCTTKGEKRP